MCPQMSNNKSFTPEYKKEIIRLVTEQGRKVSEVSAGIGISQTSIYRWIKQYCEHGEHAFPGKGNLRPEDEEIRKLEKELADLKEESEILKNIRQQQIRVMITI